MHLATDGDDLACAADSRRNNPLRASAAGSRGRVDQNPSQHAQYQQLDISKAVSQPSNHVVVSYHRVISKVVNDNDPLFPRSY